MPSPPNPAAQGAGPVPADPHAFDLILSDMTMPQMTGDRLTIEVLNIRPDIPGDSVHRLQQTDH
jgi:CheY-like chemotaxis protein